MDKIENNSIKLMLNPLHDEFYNLPKRKLYSPRLNLFNEIVYEIKWYSYPSDIKRYIKYR